MSGSAASGLNSPARPAGARSAMQAEEEGSAKKKQRQLNRVDTEEAM